MIKEISSDGIVSVFAKDMETGQQQSITVTAASGLTEDEIQRMMEENRDYLLESKHSEEYEAQRATLKRIMREVERLLPQVQEVMAGSTLGMDALSKANDAIKRAKKAMNGDDLSQLVSSSQALNRTLAVFTGIVERMQQ